MVQPWIPDEKGPDGVRTPPFEPQSNPVESSNVSRTSEDGAADEDGRQNKRHVLLLRLVVVRRRWFWRRTGAGGACATSSGTWCAHAT